MLTGLAPWTWNTTIYYELGNGLSARVSYNHRDPNLVSVCPCNNVPGNLYSIATNYVDAQVSFPLPWYRNINFTIQAQNLIHQAQVNRYLRRMDEADGATYAGQTIVVGLRGRF